ncbi:MAG TPA: hypothetical protein VLE89_04695 [Chlamydiales bacterium]|nr:hypothetical protein [Chlamydiales bacterium]
MERQGISLRSFPDHHQNYWQLASIQSAALGLPGILIGGQLSIKFGITSAIISIVIGNLVLWMIGFSIISMAAPSRDNAIENVQRYLGKFGGFLAALFLISAFLTWYILQISSSVTAISNMVEWKMSNLRLGATLGFLTALLSIGGIRFIKHFCVLLLPILIVFAGYLVHVSDNKFQINPSWSLSLVGIIAVIAVGLPGTINLPTFFRHSRSRADSYFGLGLLFLFTVAFQIFSIVVGYSDPASIHANGVIDQWVLIGFTLLALLSVNLVNIYFASAGWEMIVPQRRSTKEYVIVGLMGTMAFTFLQISKPMEFLEEMADNFIASLGIVLLLAFLVKIIVRHRVRTNEKVVNVACWLLGGSVATVMQAMDSSEPSRTLVIAIGASSIAFLSVIFAEETTWAVRKLLLKRNK